MLAFKSATELTQLLRDRQIAGGVLGGGLAYRLFFWVLALTVLGSAVPTAPRCSLRRTSVGDGALEDEAPSVW